MPFLRRGQNYSSKRLDRKTFTARRREAAKAARPYATGEKTEYAFTAASRAKYGRTLPPREGYKVNRGLERLKRGVAARKTAGGTGRRRVFSLKSANVGRSKTTGRFIKRRRFS